LIDWFIVIQHPVSRFSIIWSITRKRLQTI